MLCGGQVDDVEDQQLLGGVSPCPKSELGRFGRKKWDWNILCESCHMLASVKLPILYYSLYLSCPCFSLQPYGTWSSTFYYFFLIYYYFFYTK